MRPIPAYRCIRSGRIPSELNSTTGVRWAGEGGDAAALDETVATRPAVSRTAALVADKRLPETVIGHLRSRSRMSTLPLTLLTVRECRQCPPMLLVPGSTPVHFAAALPQLPRSPGLLAGFWPLLRGPGGNGDRD